MCVCQGQEIPSVPQSQCLACFAASPLLVPSFLERLLLGRVPGGGAEMGRRVPPIALVVKHLAGWLTKCVCWQACWGHGVSVECYQGPKGEEG